MNPAPRLRFLAMPTAEARQYQHGGPDAHGHTPERRVSDGDGVPCRHCLREVAAGDGYLVLAHRPFPAPQPYAEVGPIFVHAAACERYADEAQPPVAILDRPHMLIRGYGGDDRIVYGTGAVVPTLALGESAARLLARGDVSYVHVRSASNNCFQFRIERAADPA